MSVLNLILPTVGQPDSTEDPKINTALTAVQAWANGNIDSSNLSLGTLQSAAVNQASQTVKGGSVVSTSQATSSAAYTTLGTPDQVANVQLNTPGILAIWYHATWQESVNNAARAAIFLNSNQLKAENEGSSANPTVQETALNASNGPNVPVILCTTPLGLVCPVGGGVANAYGGDVSTGQILGSLANGKGGGPLFAFAAGGAYTVSVEFKTSSGTVTVSNRRLYVQAFSLL